MNNLAGYKLNYHVLNALVLRYGKYWNQLFRSLSLISC